MLTEEQLSAEVNAVLMRASLRRRCGIMNPSIISTPVKWALPPFPFIPHELGHNQPLGHAPRREVVDAHD